MDFGSNKVNVTDMKVEGIYYLPGFSQVPRTPIPRYLPTTRVVKYQEHKGMSG